MEDITKYIGLLGFVPVILLLLWVGKDTNTDWKYWSKVFYISLFVLCGFIWGITTLGRLL